MTGDDLGAWVGRSQLSFDYLSASPVARLRATLDKPFMAVDDGTELPPLAHWLYFLPVEPMSGLGHDGHAKRGGFLPPVHHLPRRMWAGGRLEFLRPLQVGMQVERRSTIKDIKEKSGRTGSLVFVTVEHVVTERGGLPALIEEHDIVYREAQKYLASDDYPRAPGLRAEWSREVVPDEVMLFRYSALTFNGHRIHYDQPYVVNEEFYPGLIVHGPLMATLLTDLVSESQCASLRTFSFRGMSPLFCGSALTVNATKPDGAGRSTLWIATEGDRLVMQAEARVG